MRPDWAALPPLLYFALVVVGFPVLAMFNYSPFSLSFGLAAFLFLLTSALAPLIRLSYGRMVVMAVPYTITMSITGLLALWYLPSFS